MSNVIPDEFLDLFKKRAFAHFATIMPDGSPQIMPVWVDYDGEYVLINCEYGWKWDEIFATAKKANNLVAKKSHVVDSIYNFNKTTVPLNVTLLSQMTALTSKVPANAGKVYVVEVSSFGIKMVKIFTQVTRSWANKLMVCNSIDEALNDIDKRKAVSL